MNQIIAVAAVLGVTMALLLLFWVITGSKREGR